MANLREAQRLLQYYLLMFALFMPFFSSYCSTSVEMTTRGAAVCNNSLEPACPDTLVLPLQCHAGMRTALDRKRINYSLWSHCSHLTCVLNGSTQTQRGFSFTGQKVFTVISARSMRRDREEKGEKFIKIHEIWCRRCDRVMTEQLKHS